MEKIEIIQLIAKWEKEAKDCYLYARDHWDNGQDAIAREMLGRAKAHDECIKDLKESYNNGMHRDLAGPSVKASKG